MKDQNCGYCMRGELLEKFGIFICDLPFTFFLRYIPLGSSQYEPFPTDIQILSKFVSSRAIKRSYIWTTL